MRKPTTQIYKDKVRSEIILFRGENNPLSNLYITLAALTYKGFMYISSEHAYQAAKARFHHQKLSLNEILHTANTKTVMRIGQNIRTTDAWKRVKAQLMLEILIAKSKVYYNFRDNLTQSYPAILVENTCHPYWGKGKHNSGKI